MSSFLKIEGFADTRNMLSWAVLYAPEFKYGLTLGQVSDRLEHGYQSVLPKLKDAERINQWELSRGKMREAFALYKAGDNKQATRTLQEAEELFTTLRRIKGKVVSRQELGDSEHGANEVDED
jgi:hypothetical protein